jgi:PAS domain S-box-containing protein
LGEREETAVTASVPVSAVSLRHFQVIGRSILAAVLVALIVDVPSGNWTSATTLAVIALGLAGVLLLGRTGRLRPAVYALAGVVQVGGAALVTFGGVGIHDIAMMVFPATLVVSALLLDRRGFVWAAVATVVFVAALGTAELVGILQTEITGQTDAGTIADSAMIIAVTAVAVGLLADSLKNSLARSHAQELSLQSANAALRERARELEASEERFRSLVELAVDPILLGDASGRLLEGNRRASELSGYRPEDLRGLPFESLFAEAPGDAPLALPADGTPVTTERWLRRRDGATVPVEISAKRMPDGGFQAFLRDTTARRRAVDEKTRLQEQLRQAEKMEAVGRVAGGMAHDFNNILMIVRSSVALARRDAPAGSRGERCLHEIDTASERAAALIRQLLAFSRRQELAPRRLDLDALVRGLQPMLARALGPSVRLRLASQDGPVPVEVDPVQAEHVLLNLALNARDAMPDGGELAVSLAVAELERVEAAALGVPAGRYAQLTVADTGCGMPPEVRERAFEPFFTTKPSGTGLGLATVYGAVLQNQGAIEVSSEPGRGTTFRILLPAREDGAARPEAAAGE